MKSKGIFLFTLVVILVVLIIGLSYLNYKKYINKENFNDKHEIYDTILNIKRLLEDTSLRFDCNLKKYTYPFSNEGNDYFNYISDYTFSKNSNIEELEFKNQLLRAIHSKSFYGLEKLKSLDLSGNNDLRLIGSDVFKNNLGKFNSLDEEKEFILTTPYGTNTLEQVTLRDKIMIVVYPETLYKIATVHNEIYENTQTPTFTNSIPSSLTSEWTISNDLNTEDDVRDMIIYYYIYEVIPSLESSPEKYKTVVLDLLGVNNNNIDNLFKISRKTRGQNKENREELTDQDYVNNFRIVYFKDIFFETDLAYFRTKYYNYRKNIYPEQYTSVVPDIISKYTKAVTENGVPVRKSLLEIFEEIIVRENYLIYISSQEDYSKGFNKNKFIIKDYIQSLKDIIYEAQLEAQSDSNQIFIPLDICRIFSNIIRYPRTCKYDNGSNCIEKTGVLDVNGNRVIPENIPYFPKIDVNLTPPFELLDEDAQCNTGDDIIVQDSTVEGFESENGNLDRFYDQCYANFGASLGNKVCCGYEDILEDPLKICPFYNPYCVRHPSYGRICGSYDDLLYETQWFREELEKTDPVTLEPIITEKLTINIYNAHADINEKLAELHNLENVFKSECGNDPSQNKCVNFTAQMNDIRKTLDDLYTRYNSYLDNPELYFDNNVNTNQNTPRVISAFEKQQIEDLLANPSKDCPCYAYKHNFNIGGREVERVILTEINPVIDNFYLLYRLTKKQQMTYLLKYIKILRSLDTSLDIKNIDNLYGKQIIVLSNNFYNIPTQVSYINNQQD